MKGKGVSGLQMGGYRTGTKLWLVFTQGSNENLLGFL